MRSYKSVQSARESHSPYESWKAPTSHRETERRRRERKIRRKIKPSHRASNDDGDRRGWHGVVCMVVCEGLALTREPLSCWGWSASVGPVFMLALYAARCRRDFTTGYMLLVVLTSFNIIIIRSESMETPGRRGGELGGVPELVKNLISE